MGSQMTFPFALSATDLKRNPDLLRYARQLDIESAQRVKLEDMFTHAGLRHQGLSDAVLKRVLLVAMG